MANYIIYKIETTPAHLSVDGKKHTHKYYLYPTRKILIGWGFTPYTWSYAQGKRGAVIFNDKSLAKITAREYGGVLKEV